MLAKYQGYHAILVRVSVINTRLDYRLMTTLIRLGQLGTRSESRFDGKMTRSRTSVSECVDLYFFVQFNEF